MAFKNPFGYFSSFFNCSALVDCEHGFLVQDISTRRLILVIGVALLLAIPISVDAYTTTWRSSDDPNWRYTITLSNASIKKVSSYHLDSEIKPLSTPVVTQHCNNGDSNLYPGKFYSWCYFKTADPKTPFLDIKPFVHWFFMEEPYMGREYWSGAVLRVNSLVQYFGPGFSPTVLPGTFYQEGDQVTHFRIWNDDVTWSGRQGGQIVYLSREAIEADMFGKKSTSHGTLKQRLHMTDPTSNSDTCCDTGVYEHSITYAIELVRAPLAITLPTHVDFGELAVGSDSEMRVIPVSFSVDQITVQIVDGVAKMSFNQIGKLSHQKENGNCDATVLISNEFGQVKNGEEVDLYSFRDGIRAQLSNTNDCLTGEYSSVIAFTVAWQ